MCAATSARTWSATTAISEDEVSRLEKELEKLTHEVIAEIDTMVGHKEKELLED